MASFPNVASLALKEWAVAVRALAEGQQIIVLKKGGIHREDKDFRVVHPEFLLFPTFEHQKPELLKVPYHQGLETTLRDQELPGQVTFSYWVKVTNTFEIRDASALSRLSLFHIWTDDYAQRRLHWRPKQPLTVALFRVYQLQQPQGLPIVHEYEGCKSWVKLNKDVPLGCMDPILGDVNYQRRANEIMDAMSIL